MKKLIILCAFIAITATAQTTPSYPTVKLTKPATGAGTDDILTIGSSKNINRVSKAILLSGLATETYVDTAVSTKENTITAGTTSQYWRGDKTWQTLDKTAVGLGNVDNISDANKPISNATQTALDLKANDSEVTKLSGNQVITGTKEFSNDINVNGLIIGRGNNNVFGNSVFGFNALKNNTVGSANLAIGFSSLYFNTSGDSNVAIGPGTLFSNTLGSVNVAIGNGSLSNNISGNANVAIGSSSLGNNQSGYGNIAIGEASGTDSVANITNQNSRIVMGNTSHTNAYIKIGWTVTSDARDKTNFAAVPYGLSFVNSLQPIKYQFKKSRTDNTAVGDFKYGFRAQDILALEGVNPVIIDAKDPNNLKYTESNMIPVLVKAIQELSAQVEILKAK